MLYPLRGEGKDPGGTFGPGAVPPATGSASVVYWAPGSLPKPNPRPAGPIQPALIAALSPHRAEKRLDASVPHPDAGQITVG